MLVITIFSPLFAEYTTRGIPDSAEIRRALDPSWFNASIEDIRLYNSQIRKSSDGKVFQVRMEEQEDQFFIIVAPQTTMKVDVYDSKGMHTETESSYPADAMGAWVLVRDKKVGKPLAVRYYFSIDNDIYVQFRPNGKASFCDLIIFKAFAARSVPIGIPFEKFYTASFEECRNLTGKTIPWACVEPVPGLYDLSTTMIQTLRASLNDVVIIDDAMYDEDGILVSIMTGEKKVVPRSSKDKISVSSCGFLKWIVDGLIEPIAGSYLRREPLIQPTVETKKTGAQGVLEQKFNLFFSLDWTRNLAAAALSVRAHKTYYYKDSGVDVNIDPFASVVTDKGLVNSYGYIKNTGYTTSALKSLLYVLATKEPNYFYLAAIRQTAQSTPEVKAFNECAAIFPYFDNDGRFRCAVFWDGEEHRLSEFIKALDSSEKHSQEVFVHLARVQCAENYHPQNVRQ